MAKNKIKKIIEVPTGKDLLQRIDARAGIVAESRAGFTRAACHQRSALCWMLAGLLTLSLYARHAEGKNIERQQKMTDTPSNVQVSQAQQGYKPQWASNAQGTLYGENMGDFIIGVSTILQQSISSTALRL